MGGGASGVVLAPQGTVNVLPLGNVRAETRGVVRVSLSPACCTHRPYGTIGSEVTQNLSKGRQCRTGGVTAPSQCGF